MCPVGGNISGRQGQTREGLSEGSRKQSTDLTNRNCIIGRDGG